MEEKKNTPKNPPPETPRTEIDTILQAMMKKEAALKEGTSKETADGRAPLNNLKTILSRADANALTSTPETPAAKSNKKETHIAAAFKPPKKEINPGKSLFSDRDFLKTGPIAELDALIKTHRATKSKEN